MTIIDEIHSWEIFALLFKDPRTWHAWDGYLRGLFGLELERRTRASGKDLVKHKTGGYDIHMLDARIGQFADRGHAGYRGREVKHERIPENPTAGAGGGPALGPGRHSAPRVAKSATAEETMNYKPTRPTIGPRGGRAVQATPCSDCVAYRPCRPGAISEPWGCESWVDQDGRRALPDQLEAEPVSPCEPCQGVPSECRPCGCPEVEVEPEGSGFTFETLGGLVKGRCGSPAPVLTNPDPEPEPFRPAAPYAPDPQRGEATAQAILPMPDAGPLFGGCLEAKS